MCQPLFSLYGLIPPELPGDPFRRVPQAVAKGISAGVYAEHTNTAGGRGRFVTDSAYVGLRFPAWKRQRSLTQATAVDGIHPNDLGFLCIANLLGRTLAREIFCDGGKS